MFEAAQYLVGSSLSVVHVFCFRIKGVMAGFPHHQYYTRLPQERLCIARKPMQRVAGVG